MNDRPVNQLPSQQRDPDEIVQQKLDEALKRARLAIIWERIWSTLVRVAVVAGLFLSLSWLGLWLQLPAWGRLAGLLIFAILLILALLPLRHFRMPSENDSLARLDRVTGIRHRPATALSDTLSSNDPFARALWEAQRQRMMASLSRIRAGVPSPRTRWRDPFALRGLVAVLAIATFIAAGDERRSRIAAAFNFGGVIQPSNVRVDAWVNPPVYTSRPPIIMTSAQRDVAEGPVVVPAGSVLVVRASGGDLDIATDGGVSEAAREGELPAGAAERHYSIASDGSVQVNAPSGQPRWTFSVVPDRAPVIEHAKPPERQSRGSLQLSYRIEDDYGVTEARAVFSRPDAKGQSGARALFDPPSYPLVLPNARTRNGTGQTQKDLSEDPYAGADVDLVLVAKDEAGNEGRSEPVRVKLPERVFAKPLARALIEQRRDLAQDANKREQVVQAIAALLIAPEVFTPVTGHYLGLLTIGLQAERAKTDDALREVVSSLWALAVTIEDGNINDVEKALRAAQDALREALERGASDEEIRKLTQNLQAALDKYLRQLAEQLRNNPQQLARPLDQNSRVLRQQDLNSMIERMERLSRSGDKEAARQLLEQLQQMLENLQMAQPGQGGGEDEMEQALNELGDMIRKQQQLRDRTYQEGQERRRDRSRGQQNGDMSGLQQDQQNLRERLRKLQEEMARRGMQPGQQGQRGQQGEQGQRGQGQQGQGNELGDADSAMGDADGRLGEGNADGAVDSQGRALDALRRGAQQLAESMQQGEGEGPGNGPGERAGRQQGNGPATDPLGRPLRGRDYNDDFTVRVPGEIDVQRVRRILEELRRRLGDTNRPQLELDYIERLLKDY